MKFTKSPLTIEQQICLLKDRGMAIEDEALAAHYLKHLNYYRLCAYWLPFEQDHANHHFRDGTSFQAVLNLYIFDRELRLLVLDAIERVEISVRTQWASHFSHQYGPHGYLEHQHFKQDRHGWRHGEQLQRFAQEAAHSKEDFIVHLLRQYEEDLPPLWAAVEIMSLGHLSKWIANLKHGKDRNRIARTYGMDETILVSFLHHLSIVRNLCAHHSRLWNREFTFTFRLPKRTPVPVAPVINWRAKRKLYNTLAMMTWFLDCICPEHHFRQRLTNLIGKHGIDTSAMGFPENWRELGFWNGTQDE